MTLIIVIIILLLLFGGGGYGYYGGGYTRFGNTGVGIWGILLVILVVWLLVGRGYF